MMTMTMMMIYYVPFVSRATDEVMGRNELRVSVSAWLDTGFGFLFYCAGQRSSVFRILRHFIR
jgi:hypothetical protein